MAKPSAVKVAILDDYAGVSSKYVRSMLEENSSWNVEVQEFPDTLQAKIPEEYEKQIARLKPFDIISTMRERSVFSASVISELPNLKVLLTTGPYNASIDLEECAKRGILVAGTGFKPNFSLTHGPDATNEQTWALILGVAKNIATDDMEVKKGAWQSGLVTPLAGKTLGLLGLGRLGGQCACTGKLGFGMNVIAWSTNLTQEKADEAARSKGLPPGSIRVCRSKEELFRDSDVLSVHLQLSDRSRGIVGKEELQVMKGNAILVNTSRGPLINEQALIETLEQGRIGGAGLDVFDTEPLPKDSPFRSLEWGKNGRSILVLSPHMGYVDYETMHAWYDQTCQNIKRWMDGEELQFKIEAKPSR